MAGGPEAAFQAVAPLLRRLGSSITHVGGNGQGLLLKLAINISLAAQMLAFSEGLLLAERGGIDPGLAVRVMTGSAIGSPMLQARAPLVLDLPEQAWFDVRLMHKDIRLALEAARESTIPLPAASAADSVLSRAEEMGYGHRDIAGLFQVLAATAAGPAAAPGPVARPRARPTLGRWQRDRRHGDAGPAARAAANRQRQRPGSATERGSACAAWPAAQREGAPGRPRRGCGTPAGPRPASAVSMDVVAERAGVSKATIYRWWPTKETLALDALYSEWDTGRPHPRDTGSLRSDLLALLRPWARLAEQPALRPGHRRAAHRGADRPGLRRRVPPARGRAAPGPGPGDFPPRHRARRNPPGHQIEVALDLLYGPLYHRLLHGHAPLNDRFTQDVIDMALNGIRPAPDHAATPADQLGGGQ